MAEDTRVRYNLQQISTDCVRSRTISVISGPYLLFVGYLLQSLHRPAVIFHCVLHGSVVAKWSFQVSVFISVFFFVVTNCAFIITVRFLVIYLGYCSL